MIPDWRGLLDLIYPPVCEGCGEAFHETGFPGVCPDCREQHFIPVVPPLCHVCGQPYPADMPSTMRCSNCSDREVAFDFSVAAFRAEGELLEWMHQFKYLGKIHFARMFGAMMASLWDDSRLRSGNRWTVVPVPLHRKRMRERGFNQAAEIAKQWIRRKPSGIQLDFANALRRTRYTVRQATLDRRDRLTNLRQAFEIAPRYRNKKKIEGNVILVDDVLTTGATASECAAVLRDHFEINKIAVTTVLRG